MARFWGSTTAEEGEGGKEGDEGAESVKHVAFLLLPRTVRGSGRVEVGAEAAGNDDKERSDIRCLLKNGSMDVGREEGRRWSLRPPFDLVSSTFPPSPFPSSHPQQPRDLEKMAASISSPLPSLPIEIKKEILKFCDPPTLAKTSSLSLAFLQLSSPLLYRHVTIKGPRQLKMMLSLVVSLTPYVLFQ